MLAVLVNVHSCRRNVFNYYVVLAPHTTKHDFLKICVAYNDLHRKIVLVSRCSRSTARAMLVNNKTPTQYTMSVYASYRYKLILSYMNT